MADERKTDLNNEQRKNIDFTLDFASNFTEWC